MNNYKATVSNQSNERATLEKIYEILRDSEDARDACLAIGELVAKSLSRPDPITNG